MEASRHPPGCPDEARGCGAWAHPYEDALPRGPYALNPVLGLVVAHLRVDTLGGPPERQLAQSDEVSFAEEIVDGVLRLVRDVHLALAQTFDELVGRQVDEAHLGGLLKDVVGHSLAYDDARNLGNHVVEALEVLDVEGRVD